MREHSLSQNQADSINERFNQERRDFNEKFESQNKLMTEKDREIAILKNRMEQNA